MAVNQAPAVGDIRPSSKGDMKYTGGDWQTPEAWVPATKADVAYAKARGTVVGKAAGAFTNESGEVVEHANAMAQEAQNVMGAVKRQGTGTLAGPALGWARLVGNDAKARDLGGIERAAGSQILQNAKNLKGALSDKDVAFLNSMSYNLGHSSGENTDVARVEQWAAKKAKDYVQARSVWESKLGSADGRNYEGKTFGDWWGEYSEERYPRPNFGESGDYKARPGRVERQQQQQKAPAKTAGGATVSDW